MNDEDKNIIEVENASYNYGSVPKDFLPETSESFKENGKKKWLSFLRSLRVLHLDRVRENYFNFKTFKSTFQWTKLLLHGNRKCIEIENG